jgi:thiol-disulfide isomerase/thioredoxin
MIPGLRRALPLGVLALALAWVALPGALRFGDDPGLATLDALPLRTLRGEPADLLRRAGGRPVVVNLWASWCGPCVHEMPLLAAAQRRHPAVVFVFANQGEDVFTAQHFLDANRFALENVLLDPGRTIGSAAGSRALPVTLFFDAGGRLAQTHVGVLTAGSLGAALKRIAADATGAPG